MVWSCLSDIGLEATIKCPTIIGKATLKSVHGERPWMTQQGDSSAFTCASMHFDADGLLDYCDIGETSTNGNRISRKG